MLAQNKRGYAGIGVYHIKTEVNLGTLWRSAFSFDAQFIYTIGKRYKKQASDVTKAWKHLPLFHYEAFDAFHKCIPRESLLIGVELVDKSEDIINYVHPERAVYLLGAEDSGLPDKILNKCHRIIQIPGRHCLNVATAGSIILYDRLLKWKN